MSRKTSFAAIIPLFVFGTLVFCSGLDRIARAADTESAGDVRFAALEHGYAVFVLQHFPVMATYLGGAEFDPKLAGSDGELRDYSPAALESEQSELTKYLGKFEAFDAKTLSHRYQVDQSVAVTQISFLLHEQEVRKYQQRSLDSYLDEPVLGVDWQIQGMTQTGDASYGTKTEWEAVLKRTQGIPAYLATAEKQLAAGVAAGNTPDWRMLTAGLKTSQADAAYFAKTLPELNAKYEATTSAELLTQLKASGQDAAAAYGHLHDFLAQTFFQDPAAAGAAALKPAFQKDHFAIGEAEYDWALHNNFQLAGTTAGELFTASWPVVQQTEQEMISLAGQIDDGHGWPHGADGRDDVRIAFEKLSESAPANDEALLAGYRKVGDRLVAYARKTNMFDVPPDYRLDVESTPEPLRDSVGNAGFYPAPPFKQTGVGRFYVTPTGNDGAALREEDSYPSMAVLAAHEGFPGHALHYSVMTHWRDEISPIRWLTPGAVEDSSSMWEDSMAIEGWAFYCESLMAEAQPDAPNGFYTPEERLYQLRGELLRDLRVRLDTGIHTGRLSFDDAVDLFSQNVDFLPGSCRDADDLKDSLKKASCDGARQQVARYARWPTQAIAYRIGKEQILALRARAEKELGSSFSLKVFHLALMMEGTIPVTYFGDDVIKSMGYQGR